jgi:selenocysteine lyase/cysteine desulfurase
MIYLDNAATSFPKPSSVYESVMKAMKVYGANPGRGSHAMAIEGARIIYETRELLADLQKLFKKMRKDVGNCTVTDIMIDGNKINIIVQNDVDEVLMHSHDFDENPLIKFLKNRKPIDRSGIYWGNKTDAEMEEYNKTAHW